ncbi:MAG: hypothetical protein PHO10_12345, partial [Gemmiger sp.]|nr:hypothetical protein [Gemmiger sp.]
MKKNLPPPRHRGRKAERPTVKSLFAQPPADFYRLPALEVRGGCVVTDACRRVLAFTPERILLDFGDSLVTFYGAGLKIESLAGKRLV